MKIVHRREDGSIAVVMSALLPGYSFEPKGDELLAEMVEDDDPGLAPHATPAAKRDDARITELEADLASLKQQLQRLEELNPVVEDDPA